MDICFLFLVNRFDDAKLKELGSLYHGPQRPVAGQGEGDEKDENNGGEEGKADGGDDKSKSGESRSPVRRSSRLNKSNSTDSDENQHGASDESDAKHGVADSEKQRESNQSDDATGGVSNGSGDASDGSSKKSSSKSEQSSPKRRSTSPPPSAPSPPKKRKWSALDPPSPKKRPVIDLSDSPEPKADSPNVPQSERGDGEEDGASNDEKAGEEKKADAEWVNFSDSKMYYLRSVIHHSGTSTARGHYYMDAYDPSRKRWRRWNDNMSHEVR